MNHRRPMIPWWCALLTAAALAALPFSARADREIWGPVLADQIFAEHQCVVAFLSQVVEREVDGREAVIAKVHCEDDRAFDVTRIGILGPFDITECDRPNQETC